ncbi:Pentatricopeptide repeat-containing protein [Rhynchospora pubera]|uniref:Pentatricopeptide repeat-containing protein n=1 Tax=Rhynchospora pubera TaxID=906938 RepID=A0AAV8HKC0_9POAL|nr:Pentatricopeptide repeat-containing protein [Rhynchospora pubera]
MAALRKPPLSASVKAIRQASSPKEALTLFKLRLRGLFPPDPFDQHAAVFTLKSISSSRSLRPSLTPLLHAYVLKTNLLSEVHVAPVLLHCYSLFSHTDARVLFDEIPHRTLVITNTMISSIARSGDVKSARLLFDSCPDKDIFSWSAMIRGYIGKNHKNAGLSLFRKMMLQGELKPDAAVITILLSGCSACGSMSLLLCRSIHAYAVKNVSKTEMNRELGTSLLTVYTEAGNLKYALSVFDMIPEKNVTHWTAMIKGLAMLGQTDKALSHLQKMVNSGVKPNEFTFTTILDVCCQAGFIDQAQKYFSIMVQELGFKPRVQHYGCLVNLFAKAGRLDEAYGVIKCMDVEPNIIIWTSFLEACRKYKKFKMAEEGIEKVLSMARPDENGGVYTLISDLYALGGNWAGVERIRLLMDQQKVAKIAGLSFVEGYKRKANAVVK